MPPYLRQATAPTIERLRGVADFLDELVAAKQSIARVDGCVRHSMDVYKADINEYGRLWQRIRESSARSSVPAYHVFVQDCLVRSVA